MKRLALPIAAIFVALTAASLSYNGIFSFVKATPKGEDILIQWKSATENGVYSYDVERNSEESAEFRKVGRVNIKGAGSVYTFVDNGAFFKTESAKRFTYRVKAVGQSLEEYSTSATVVHDVSGVRRTWGMIKELFR